MIKEGGDQKNKLKEEMRRIESDLVRIRAGRDHLQGLLESKVAKEQVEINGVREVKGLVEDRKIRIECLESQVERLDLEILGLKNVNNQNASNGGIINEKIAFHEKVWIICDELIIID